MNPGSELRVRFRRTDHPLAYGYPETTSVFREGGPVYAVRKVDEGRIVLQWGTALPKEDEAEAVASEKKRRPEEGRASAGGERRGQGRGGARGQAGPSRHSRPARGA